MCVCIYIYMYMCMYVYIWIFNDVIYIYIHPRCVPNNLYIYVTYHLYICKPHCSALQMYAIANSCI